MSLSSSGSSMVMSCSFERSNEASASFISCCVKTNLPFTLTMNALLDLFVAAFLEENDFARLLFGDMSETYALSVSASVRTVIPSDGLQQQHRIFLAIIFGNGSV